MKSALRQKTRSLKERVFDIYRLRDLFFLVNAYALAAAVFCLKTDDAVDLGVKGVILADTDVGAGMEVSAALPDENIAREDKLTVSTLGPQTLGFAFTTVAGASYALFMCKKLQIEPEHIKL